MPPISAVPGYGAAIRTARLPPQFSCLLCLTPLRHCIPSPLTLCETPLPPRPPHSYTFHYMVDDGITYLCLADEQQKRRIPFLFLQDVKERLVPIYPLSRASIPYKSPRSEVLAL